MDVLLGGLRLDTRTGFQRSYLIFANEDAGYEAGQKPSGHVKLEVRDGRGKLHASVQNLKPGNGRYEYKLYLLRSGRDGVTTVCAGQLVPELNKAELEWGFDPRNVGSYGCSIEEFSSLAILVEYLDRPIDAIICPLAAYRGKKLEWRSGLRTAMFKKKTELLQIKETMDDNCADNIEPLYNKEIIKETADAQQPQQGQPYAQQPQQRQPYAQQPQQGQPYAQQPQQGQPYAQQPQQGQPYAQQPQQGQPYAQHQNNLGQIDTSCIYLNGNICGAFVNSGTSSVNPCNTCRMHSADAPASAPPVGDVALLKIELDRYFEKSDPFNSKRSDYLWWRVNNPVNLNTLLYQCNIRSPLLFNPVVMMAHYKYRHLIIGIFQQKAEQRQYAVCGVPGMYMVDTKPFGEMSKWVQVEGNRPKYGAFGYWLVYINPDDGKILNMSRE